MASALQVSISSSVSAETIQRNAKQGIEAFAHKNSHAIIEHIGAIDSEIERIAPCTPLQEGIIYHYLSSSTPLYCSSFTFELDPSVNIENLRSAWDQAQRDVQMLRARLLPSPDGYAQVIMKKLTTCANNDMTTGPPSLMVFQPIYGKSESSLPLRHR